jgi:hypothetical protein
MPRTLAFWEKKRKNAEEAMQDVHIALRAITPRAAPRRRRMLTDDSGNKVLFTNGHHSWSVSYDRWKQSTARRHELVREIEKLTRRIAYCDERIAALKKKTAWRTVTQGLL